MVNTYPKPIRKPGRVDLIPEEFDNLVEDHGVFVRITPAIICPRRSGQVEDASNVNHDLNCPVCYGIGIIDLPAHAVEDWAYIQSIKLDKTFDQQSRFDIKDAFMTTRAPVRLSYSYKIELIDFASQFNELLRRGRTGTEDRLRYEPKDVEDGNIYVAMDGDGIEFVKDVEYEINGQHIKWLTASKPQRERLYSFLYPVLPTFRVMESLHENRYYYDGFKKDRKVPIQLPQQVHIRWDFMAVGKGSDIPKS